MNQKIRLFAFFIISFFFVGSIALFCNPQNTSTGAGNNDDEGKILETMHPFYDAQILVGALDEKGKEISLEKIKRVFNVLHKYYTQLELPIDKTSLKTEKNKLENIIKENPFLEKYLKGFYEKALEEYKTDYKESGDNIIEPVTVAPSGAAKGILSPVMVVDALGSFIAKRFKEELTIAYLEKFKKKLNENKDKGWTLLVPTTFTFLENSDPFNFKIFISTLKQSFQNDLNNLDSNLKNFLIKHKEKIEEKVLKLILEENGGTFKETLREALSTDEEIKKSIKKIDIMEQLLKIKKLKAEINDLSGQNKEDKLSELKDMEKKLKETREKLKTEIDKLKADIKSSSGQNKETKSNELKDMEKKLENTETAIDKLKELKNLKKKFEKKEIAQRLRFVLWKDKWKDKDNGAKLKLKKKLEKIFSNEIKELEDSKDKSETNKRILLLKELKISIENRDILNLAILILDLIQDVKSRKHPADIIDTISESGYIDQIDHKISNPIRLMAILSRSLRNKEGDGWVKLEEFKKLSTRADTNFQQLFLGLIYVNELEQLKKIKFKNEPFDQIILKNENKIIENIKKTTEHIHKALAIAKNIQEKIEELGKIEKKGFENYYSYLTTVFELIEHGFDIKDFINDKKTQLVKDVEKAQKYLKDAKKLLEISKNIHDKAYGVALVNTVTILKDLLPESAIKDEIIKYGTFMVSMVSAKDAKEMENVLAAAALPVGSYRLKRTSRFTISLNTYPGVFGGVETLTTSETLDGKKEGLNLAFTAPVGLDFCWGKKRKKNKTIFGPSNSLFISVIDIGAVVSFRLSGADTGLPEFKWENILAPGIFWMRGFKNSPISFGLGIQYGPQLRKITPKADDAGDAGSTKAVSNGGETAEAVFTASAWRFGLIIAVDIPIFNFHSKRYK